MLDVLKENNIIIEYIANNLKNYYQPLDFTTNKWAKEFMKNKFSTWFTEEIRQEESTWIEYIDIKLALTARIIQL